MATAASKMLLMLRLLAAAAPGSCLYVPKGPERYLFDDLLDNYEAGTRPVLNASTPIIVNLSISLHQIMDLDEKNQTLITHTWIYEEWYDELLTWDPDEYEGLNTTILPAERVWVPDLYIFNNAEKGNEGFVIVNDSRVMVHATGHVAWLVPLMIKSSCTVDVTYFPFDNQRCFIRIGSWIYDEAQLDLIKKQAYVDLTQFVKNKEYDLLDIYMEQDQQTYDIFSGLHPQITVRMHIRRRPLFYAYTVIAPTLVLCILTLFSFMLPCDNGAKVGIGLTVFLALYVLQLAIAENMPESNSLPLIGLFLTLVMTLNSISLLFATLVINIKKKGERKPCPEVPPLVLALCRRVLARITCTRMLSFFDFYDLCETEIPSCDDGRHSGEETEELSSIEDLTQPTTSKRSRRIHHRGQGRHALGSYDQESLYKRARKNFVPPRDLKQEWYFVAQVLDKSLFILFFTGMTMTVIFPLFIIPYIHRND